MILQNTWSLSILNQWMILKNIKEVRQFMCIILYKDTAAMSMLDESLRILQYMWIKI